jgi:hypothetical protein
MIYKSLDHERPKPWRQVRATCRHWAAPFVFIDWLIQWAAFALSRFSLLELLEYCGSFSILFAVVLYFVEAPQRQKMKHYEAWQVINSAQGKGGNGGRFDALEDLNQDHISFVGIDLSDASLEGITLPRAEFRRAKMTAADFMNSNLKEADLDLADLTDANFRSADLTGTNLSEASLNDVDLTGAALNRANVEDAEFNDADLTNADLSGIINWKTITHFSGANIHAVRNAPDGFIAWAKSHGAVDTSSDSPTTAPGK